jgi:hypothetical protein
MTSLIACQQEQVIINDPQANSLDAMSPLADLVGLTTLNDGSADNIIDNSSCITVVLPVNVIANGIELNIATPDDFVLIERIFDESADDTDVLDIIYPIEVILSDYDIEEISSDSDLAEVTADCLENGLDDDIECVDFKYPLSLSVYNANNQVAEVIEFTSDSTLYDFLESLDDQLFFTFNYPVTMMLSDSSEVVVYSNAEMEALIDEVDDSCDEDDDSDYNDDDADTTELSGILMARGWEVTYLFNVQDQTSAFENIAFAFRESDLAEAYTGNLIIEGDWGVYGDDGTLEFELEFTEEYPFSLLEEEDWSVVSYDSLVVELRYESEAGNLVYLTLEATDLPGMLDPTIADNIVDGAWQVASFKDDGVDETTVYADYKINFTADFKLTYYNQGEIFAGEWDEILNAEEHLFVLDFNSGVAAFDKLDNEWAVVSYSATRIELTTMDTAPEVTDNLVLEKL